MPKKVFVSYDHSEDGRYKELLTAWDANTNFDFEFDQRSPDTPVDGTEAGVAQVALTEKMKESEYILVIIGKDSHANKWMNWEIQKAKQDGIKLKFAAVKIDRNNVNPDSLPIPATSFAYSFTMEGVINALKQARNRY